MKKTILSILIILLLATTVNAFSIRLTNTMDKMMLVRVTWLACDWDGFPPSISMLIGEIQPGDTSVMEGDYKPGPWSITWQSTDFGVKYEFVVPSNKGTLISVPDATPIFYPGT